MKCQDSSACTRVFLAACLVVCKGAELIDVLADRLTVAAQKSLHVQGLEGLESETIPSTLHSGQYPAASVRKDY